MKKMSFKKYVLSTTLILIFALELVLIINNYNKWEESISTSIEIKKDSNIVILEKNEELNRKKDFILNFVFFLSVNVFAFFILYVYWRKYKEFELKLQNEKEKSLITLKSIGDAVITTDDKGYVTFFNPIAEKLTGFKNEEAIGKYIDEVFPLINLFTKNRISSPIKKVLYDGEITTLAKNTALISKNNDIYSIEDSAAPIKNRKNKVIGVVLVFHDTTKEREYKTKLNENEKILIQQSKMASMGEMLGNIAHQWRQPLSVISTSATGLKLKKQLDELDDEFLFNTLDLINNSSQHLSRTIDDFRNFFKPNKRKDYFYIKPLYERAITLLSSKFTNREIDIVDNINNIEIYGYENELIQVFMNIFNNTLDVLEKKNGVKVMLVNIYSKDEEIYIEVLDNGGGILKNIIDRIFEPYFTTKHQGQGTGIGLYMTQEIILTHMNGKINVENKKFDYKGLECCGAFFQIIFPIK